MNNIIVSGLMVIIFSPIATFNSVQADDAVCEGKTQIDHYMVGVANLTEAAKTLAAQTGITPIFGGVHTGGATANFLASLGNCQYLELVGPNPRGQADNDMSKQLKTLNHPTLLGIAYASHDLEGIQKIAHIRGLTVGNIEPGGRKTPTGQQLNWRTLSFNASGGFFIDWMKTKHPSTSTPKGLKVTSFTIQWPHAEDLKSLHQAIGLDLPITQAEHGQYSLTLEGPKGSVTYSSN